MKFFRFLAILGYGSFGIMFLFYLFSDSNEVIGYYDISFLIIGIIIPVVIVSEIYKKEKLKRLLNLSYQIFAVSSLLYFIAVLQKINSKDQSEFEGYLYHLSASIFTLIISTLLFYFFDFRPKIKKRKELKKRKAEQIRLLEEGRAEVEKNNIEFKIKLNELYGDRFDYSDVILEEFIGLDSRNTIKIIQKEHIKLVCKKHDVQFNENIRNVFNSVGCERCKVDNDFKLAKRKKERDRFNEFKMRLNKAFNEKYDFSKVEFKGLRKKISVSCPNHGSFQILPTKLLKGYGCPICNAENSLNSKKSLNISENSLLGSEEIKVTKDEYQVLYSLLKKLTIDVGEIKKVGEDTKEAIENIDKNINVLIEIEKLKITGVSKNEDELISEILNLIESQIEFENISSFKTKVKNWFKSWDKLEPLSQEFMPQSEFLYDSIEKSKFTDYSPFILYYCRVLEFELLNKIFLKYHNYLEKKFKDKKELFEYDSEGLKKSTIKDLESGMMKSFKLKVLKNDAKYTLGEMRLILNILPSKTKPQGSERYKTLKALQELNYFINDNIGNIESEIIVKIENIIKKYRNPSAHIGTINKESADEFYSIYKTTMNDLFDSLH